ncbi:MAG: cytochrome c family protein [Phycisphaerales bacterium]|nr:cytochrome c family protein [Phycisphaerales bacterium]
MPSLRSRRVRAVPGVLWLAISISLAGATPPPTALEDFFGPGSQPGSVEEVLDTATRCGTCHGNYDFNAEPYRPWAASPMGQAARDPAFHAAMTIANQDAPFAGDLCLRCHMPQGWIQGRSVPTDGSAMLPDDFQGVSCSTCHRMVDPFGVPSQNPPDDVGILAGTPDLPVNPHSGQYVIDPSDIRRGPFNLDNFNQHQWRQAPFFAQSSMCITCHDVSNPVYSRQVDGTYAPNEFGQPAPSHDKYDQFPVERTGSEWMQSAFAQGPIEMGGRFGGNLTAVSSCQDCHMPDTTGRGCSNGSRPIRGNLPTHQFNGGNTWLLHAVRNLYPDSVSLLDAASVNASIARTVTMLQNASDLDAWQDGTHLVVRVINQSGHKLPTGYPEGRRAWVNVVFRDAQGNIVREHGHYDAATALLDVDSTKVYEAKIGVDAAVSALTGVPEGPSFHFALNNTWYKDNRIPPRGFTNAGFAAVQAAPVASSYLDGQYWDDTEFAVPAGATEALVRVYYQSVSREYAEFLLSENVTNDTGLIFYQQWIATGRSAPVLMDSMTLAVEAGGPCNDADFAEPWGTLDFFDVQAFLQAFSMHDPSADLTGEGLFDFFDVQAFLAAFSAGCP